MSYVNNISIKIFFLSPPYFPVLHENSDKLTEYHDLNAWERDRETETGRQKDKQADSLRLWLCVYFV